MLPDSSKSLVSCCGYNMGMIKWTGNDLLTSKTIKKYILPKPYTGISRGDWSRATADKSAGRENDVVMAQFVFLFTHVVSQQVSMKMDANNSQCNGFEIFSFSVEIIFRVAIRNVFIFTLVSGFCCGDQLIDQHGVDLC